jgi:dipeptidyl aminopeptidase/acylaminoacyl peptidase
MNTQRTVAFVWLVTMAVVGLAVAPSTPAADEATSDHLSDLPPLIDRDVFFGDPEISGAQISPDGKWVSFRKSHNGVMNIWVKKLSQSFDAAKPVTADTERPVRGYFWTQDSRYILYVQDKGGDENHHVYAVDPKGKTGKDGVPEARDLTPIEGAKAQIYAVPEATPNQILVGLNDRDPAMHDVYRLDIDTGERTLLIQNENNIAAWEADLSGEVRLAFRTTDDGGSELLRVEDGKIGEAIYTCTFEESCAPYRFHKDGKQVYIVSNKGDDVDLARLMLMDAETGETELVESDPEGEVDFGAALFSDVTEELIGTVYVGDRQRIYPRADGIKKELEFLRAKLPDGEIGVASSTADERYRIVAVSRDVNPGEVWLFDTKKMKLKKLYDSRPDLPSEHLATMQPLRYKARDGLEIPAYLTIPKGAEPKNLPVIILPHGGPWARDVWGYDAIAQFLANRGYAVLLPNFRASTGYGKAFLNAGNKEWGTGAMQHDLTDAVKHLVDEGIADPKRVAIMGGSYGGYATLAGVTFTPDLYAAGVSIVGPSNIITLLDSIPPYWGPIKNIFFKRVGDPDDPEDRKRLEEQSPFYHATAIKAPLLVIQGANDPRVKQAESDMIVVALRDLERPVEYLVAPDEGHGFAGEENRLAMFAVTEEFLAKHLGGRHQEGAAPVIEERIASLTVDISTVEMPMVPQGFEMAKTSALPVPDMTTLKPFRAGYVTEVTQGTGDAMTIESTRELATDTFEEREVWRVASLASLPAGEVSDVYYLDTADLGPLRREVRQGPVSVDIDFSDETVTGLIDMGGRETPIDVTLDAPVLGTDAALEAVLCQLPLESGYITAVRTFDPRSQKVRVFSFEVTGEETIEVEAGTFETWVTTMTALDDHGGDGTIWISKSKPGFKVRSEFLLPAQMGGGSIATRLTSQE